MSLSRRDQFALAAMQGLLSCRYAGQELSKKAVEIADALIAELDRTAPKPAPKPASELPEWVPPLPEGAVLLGRAGEFIAGRKHFLAWCSSELSPNWDYGKWRGDGSGYYAVRADSEIAKLNGKEAA